MAAASSYTPQDVAFMPMATAREAVVFAATMAHGRPPDDAPVDDVLGEVGLGDVGERRVGGELAGGFVVPGLSGGERRRLAVACAVATGKELAFLDEVTSRAAKGCESRTFGRLPVSLEAQVPHSGFTSSYLGTSDHLSSRSRTVNAFFLTAM